MVPQINLLDKKFNGFQSLIDLMNIQERHNHPSLQQAGSHGRNSIVEHTKQIHTILHWTMQELQVANGKLIHPQVVIFFNSLDGSDVLKVWMLSVFQVLKHCTCSNNARMQVFHSKSFEGMCLKMFQQTFSAVRLIKNPTLQGVSVKLGTKNFFELFLKLSLKNYFSRP